MLPTELVALTLQNLDPENVEDCDALNNCMLVSRIFRSWAERILFADVVLDDFEDTKAYLKDFEDAPHRCQLVRHLEIDLQVVRNTPMGIQPRVVSIFPLCSKVEDVSLDVTCHIENTCINFTALDESLRQSIRILLSSNTLRDLSLSCLVFPNIHDLNRVIAFSPGLKNLTFSQVGIWETITPEDIKKLSSEEPRATLLTLEYYKGSQTTLTTLAKYFTASCCPVSIVTLRELSAHVIHDDLLEDGTQPLLHLMLSEIDSLESLSLSDLEMWDEADFAYIYAHKELDDLAIYRIDGGDLALLPSLLLGWPRSNHIVRLTLHVYFWDSEAMNLLSSPQGWQPVSESWATFKSLQEIVIIVDLSSIFLLSWFDYIVEALRTVLKVPPGINVKFTQVQ